MCMNLEQKTFKQMTEEEKAKNKEYADFLEKFEEKHTSDDCFTPENIYEVVADYVSEKFGVSRDAFVRPFYPGGDYENFNYPSDCVVVDNPPFSILSKICRFYQQNNIKFFIFANGLTVLGLCSKYDISAVCVGATFTYKNGAGINTSFATNLFDTTCIMSEPKLYAALEKANKENLAKIKKHVSKYDYPAHVITAARLNHLSLYGESLCINLENCKFIRKLDAQKEDKKAIFGAGFLLSDLDAHAQAQAQARAQAQLRAQEQNKIVYKLSDREREIVEELNKNFTKPIDK